MNYAIAKSSIVVLGTASIDYTSKIIKYNKFKLPKTKLNTIIGEIYYPIN